ncbi:hypothetical protein FQN60_010645 [Etheostoma spectabile]|uniref:Uncharacterized protein n=1 Tax=Etheostoma spectabile TaxID=54343 RepID=A0A5J5C9Y1_9PERO|nr:hypothetical protein FQN60_010645 [Etheostoma spectabile]
MDRLGCIRPALPSKSALQTYRTYLAWPGVKGLVQGSVGRAHQWEESGEGAEERRKPVYSLCLAVLHPGLHHHLLPGDSRGLQHHHQQDRSVSRLQRGQ